ncbi:hypothetical protein KQI84_06435 [bacterium]|nr:hypothetical protein [bacterium]
MPSPFENPRQIVLARIAIVVGFFVLAWVQLSAFVHDRPDGEWFLFGTDTVAHDAVVQMWVWDQVRSGGGEIPLWMPPLKGGLPTVGAFLWTPFAPSLWLHAILDFPLAQRLQFVIALWWAALGGYWLARVLGMRRSVALAVGIGFGLCGHVVTLIHAGHLQKVLALAWMGWFAGGMVKALAAESDWRDGLVGTAAAALALGAAFLSGHPQIAYIMAMMAGGRFIYVLAFGGWRAGRWRAMAVRLVLIWGLGGCVGAAQLLPGMEMSALSNRGTGVEFAEAVETSYPSLETLELILPRFLGDNSRAGHGQYFGGWGERIVSDYAGVALVLLALVGILSGRRREWGFWAAMAIVSLLVGLGDSVPLYRVLYEFWPGMKSFRSPGTFMAAMALALPVMSGFGLQFVIGFLRREHPRRQTAMIAFALLALCSLIGFLALHDGDSQTAAAFTIAAIRRSLLVLAIAGALLLAALLAAVKMHAGWLRAAAGCTFALLFAVDLMSANSAFLLAVDWDDYSAYLAPNAVDEFAVGMTEPCRVLELGREQSLRPILNGRDSMLGYHPISYAQFEDQLNELGAGSWDWRQFWGVPAIWSPQPLEDVPGVLEQRRLNSAPGGVLLINDQVRPIRFSGTVDGIFEWLERGPNREVLRLEVAQPATCSLAETIAPGWRWRVDEGEWNMARDVALKRDVSVGAGIHRIEWEYRPFSFQFGVFLTGLAFGVLFLLTSYCARRESGSLE